MSERTKNRFENWPDSDVSKFIDLEKEVSSRKSASIVGISCGFVTLLAAPLDGFGFAAVVILIIGWAFYEEVQMDKARRQLNDLNLKNLPWPPV